MPAGRNQVYGPSGATVFDPPGIRGNRKIYKGAPVELPPYSVTGVVDATGESPGFPVRATGTITECAVTVESTGGTAAGFSIRVNGVSVSSHSANAAGLVVHDELIPVEPLDIVSVAITSYGTGLLTNLLIVLR